MKRVLTVGGVGCGALVLVLLCVGTALVVAARGGLPGAATATPAVHALRTPIPDGNWTLTVGAPWSGGTTLVWSAAGDTSAAAGTWLVVPVELTNTGAANFGVNSWDFRLTDAAGHRYAVSDDLGALAYSAYAGGLTLGGQVPPGVAGRYYLVFDVAPAATGLRLQFLQGDRPAVALGR